MQAQLWPAVVIHERAWDQPPGMIQAPFKPVGTYTLLGLMVGVYVLQQLVGQFSGYLHWFLFAIGPLETGYGVGWWLRPWTVITSTLAHSPFGLGHLMLNGLVLYFMGPILERILGIKKFLTWFFVAGAISGIAQVTIDPGLALGASGAINFIIGALVMIMPNEKVLFWGIIPMPFWALGVLYVVLDLVGAFGLDNEIGNFAHLSGMALGLWIGYGIKQNVRM